MSELSDLVDDIVSDANGAPRDVLISKLKRAITELEEGPCRFDCRKGYPKQIALLRLTLDQCRTKLEIYRDHSDGVYHGGIEHCSLIGNINTTLSLTEEGK